MTTSYTGPFHQNRLLASLPPGTVARLSPHLQPFTFTFGKALLDPGDDMPDIYFPLSGMLSVITVMLTGTALETRLVGSEGMAPLEALLGVQRAPQRLLIQAGGEALRLPGSVLREQARADGPLHDLLERYTAATLLQTAQAAACNGLHTVDARLARWLLLAQDRVDGTTLPMTHRFLGLMLGVRRASVTSAASGFQKAGLIRSLYGRVDIVDRAALEAASCECYSRMRGATEQVFAGMQ